MGLVNDVTLGNRAVPFKAYIAWVNILLVLRKDVGNMKVTTQPTTEWLKFVVG